MEIAFIIFTQLVILVGLLHIKKTLNNIEALLKARATASVIKFFTLINGHLTEVSKMNVKVTETKQASIKITDAKGNAALVDGVPTWSLSDQSLGSLAVAADGMSAVLTPSGPLGSCKLEVHADADLGSGVVDIVGSADLEFVAGDAASIEISLS